MVAKKTGSMNESLNSEAEPDATGVVFLRLGETVTDPVCWLSELAEKPVGAISNGEKGQAGGLVTLVG